MIPPEVVLTPEKLAAANQAAEAAAPALVPAAELRERLDTMRTLGDYILGQLGHWSHTDIARLVAIGAVARLVKVAGEEGCADAAKALSALAGEVEATAILMQRQADHGSLRTDRIKHSEAVSLRKATADVLRQVDAGEMPVVGPARRGQVDGTEYVPTPAGPPTPPATYWDELDAAVPKPTPAATSPRRRRWWLW
jgi:hypothetical protein